jgi:hypothetical protein
MRSTFLALAALSVAPPAAAHDRPPITHTQAHNPAECYCRAQGRMFAVGETACLRTGEGARLAECGMVLNNTSWRFTERPCPES